MKRNNVRLALFCEKRVSIKIKACAYDIVKNI